MHDREKADMLAWNVAFSHRDPDVIVAGNAVQYRRNATLIVIARTCEEAIEAVRKSNFDVKVWNATNLGSGVLFAERG